VRLTTFLTYADTTSQHPLAVALVLPLSAPVSLAAKASPANTIRPLTTAQASSLEDLIDALHSSAVPVTIEPSPRSLQSLDAAGPAGKAAVETLSGMSANQSVDEIPAQPYTPVDLATLAAAGETTEIAAQIGAGKGTLESLHVTAQTPGPTTPLVASGVVGPSTFTALSQINDGQLVVPEPDLVQDALPTTWASTFTITGGKGTSAATPQVAAADGTLTGEFPGQDADPVLAATRLLADLAMVHFEEPNTTRVRGVVAVPPPGWQTNTAFDDTLLAGLQGNPDVSPVTLAQYFKTVSDGGTRRLKSTSTQTAAGFTIGHNARVAMSSARLRLTAFDSAVPRAPAPVILTQLNNILLCAEAATTPQALSAGIADMERALRSQLDRVTFALDQTITLTATTGLIPVTVFKSLPYPVSGVLTVSGDKFTFHSSPRHVMVLTHVANPWRFDVQVRSPGESPLRVTFSAGPHGTLVFASDQLRVRSTATSVVGVVLTAVALAVLLAWWARTWRAGRRRAGRDQA
jgi:hypothetical protein